jgi:hypothetical protein
MITPTQTRWQELQMLENALRQDPGISRSLVLNRRGYRSLNDALDNRATVERHLNHCKDRLDSFLETSIPIFQPAVRRELESVDFYNGIQWDQSDIQAINEAGVYAHQSNLHTRWVKTLMGEHVNGQTVPYAVADDSSHDNKMAVGLLNNGLMAVTQEQQYSRKEQQWFFDGVVRGRGYMSVAPDICDPQGSISIKRVRPEEIMFDVWSAEDGALTNVSQFFRGGFRDLEGLIYQYPEWDDMLRKFAVGPQGQAKHDLYFTLLNPKPQYSLKARNSGFAPTENGGLDGRYQGNGFSWLMYSARRSRKLAYTMEFYNRRTEHGYAVYDIWQNVDHHFTQLPQALYFYKNLREAYALAFAAEGLPDTLAAEAPRPYGLKMIDREVWCGDVLLEYKSTETETIPYFQYACDYHDGYWRGFFDDDHDHQRVFNRMFVILDQLLGSSKSKDVVNLHYWPKGTTQEKAKDVMTRASEPVVINDMRPDAAQSAMYRYDAANNSQAPAMIMDFVRSASQQQQGGLNSIGQPAFAGQSAKHATLMTRSAQSGTGDVFAELRYSQENLGESLAYHIQFLRPGIRLAFVDSQDRMQYIQFTQEGIRDIRRLKYKIEISETLAMPTERDRRQMAMFELFGQSPDLIKHGLPYILEASDWEQTKIDGIVASVAEERDYLRQQAEREQGLKEFVEQTKWSLAGIDRTLKELDIRLKNLPDLTVVAKINQLGPGGISEIMEARGIPADPDGVEDDLRRDNAIIQDAANTAQEEWLKRAPAVEKERPANTKTPGKPATAKDRVNRTRKN